MTVTDRTDATDAEFRSRIAPFESAPTPPEVVEARVVEEVARAISETRDAHSTFGFPCRCGWDAGPVAGWEKRLDHHRQLAAAAAAVAAYRAAQDGGAEEALRRVEALAEELDDVARDYRHVPPGTHDAGARNAHMAIARRIRAALAPQAGDGAR